jgi:predicted DNA-binding protein (MmcQ/YjbR family)
MDKNNPNERIYLRPSKPINEMTDEEIRTLAEETYEQIIRTLAEKKNTETK